MKINPIQNNSINFNGALNNKLLLNGLEAVSEHSASFIALTSLAMASVVRPVSIALTPKTKKENKQYAITNSVASGLVKFAMVEAIALPIENAVKKIDKNPELYLKQDTIKNLKNSASSLAQSGDYKFATQLLKLSSGLISAIPKSMITVALIPLLTDILFKHKKEKPQSKYTNYIYNQTNSVFKKDFEQDRQQPSFKGLTETAAKGIGKLLDSEASQNIVKKYSSKSSDIAKNVTIATDVLLASTFALRTKKSKKIDKERKNPLIFNNLISTGFSVAAGSAIDSFVKKNSADFINKFKEVNKNNPKLPKYIEGLNVVRPTLIFAAIYYGLLPVISTFISDKTEKLFDKKA